MDVELRQRLKRSLVKVAGKEGLPDTGGPFFIPQRSHYE